MQKKKKSRVNIENENKNKISCQFVLNIHIDVIRFNFTQDNLEYTRAYTLSEIKKRVLSFSSCVHERCLYL